MFWSRVFIPTLKETPKEAESLSHQLLLRAGFARMLMAGAYTYLPMGLRVLEKIQRIIRQEMNAIGASELLLPALHPLELWQRTGRDKDLGEVMYKLEDRRGRKLALGPTHEEVITDLVKNNISSYRQLPLVLYQIQTKFRDEMRPRFGLIRCCEFIMKDAYSFDQDEEGLDKNYRLMHEAYRKIFARCGLKTLITEADSGVMGGKVSHEFMAPSPLGEDIVLSCPKCGTAKAFQEEGALCPSCGKDMEKVNTTEVGHIFKLGTKYSQAMQANFSDHSGQLKPLIMGCYGIGVSRLVATIIEQNNDADGIIWPAEVAPFDIVILPLDVNNRDLMESAERLYRKLRDSGKEVLLDDRDERAGIKFKDADLTGIPLSIVVGKKGLEEKKVELRIRKDKSSSLIPEDSVPESVSGILSRTG
ncbi:MAG: proline--tRNA ligase [Candidatus Omnitrophica bacterium]|jgi:prolyl-tRNA synthetase|nr:proline--tRNA ligase [Candidatus Omnitrophota bacterium]MDD5724932.1 proline--tRNA ligase [Candidatus Omnitrophota bacterium]